MDLVVPQSYITVEYADSYFTTQLNSDVWDAALPNDKLKGLYEATRAIDRLAFVGVKTNYYNHRYLKQPLVDQPLEFPRDGLMVVPEGILFACCECAQAFLDGFDIDSEINRIGVLSHSFAAVKQTKRTDFIPPYILAGIPSAKAWMYLIPYLADPREIRRIRTTI